MDQTWKACGRDDAEKNSCRLSGLKRLTKFAAGTIRTPLRLFRCRPHATVCRPFPLRAVTHRYEEHIAGRTYEIEVRAVSQSRWRAQIARRPGLPTSLMPFYGPTPEEAALQLRRWLALVYNGTTKQ